jgi:hypothetical protein
MKHVLQLAPLWACLAACQSSPTTPAPPKPASATAAAPAPDNPEYIEATMLTVNGELVKELTTTQLTRQFGRPDSIAKGAVECGAMLASLNKLDSPDGDMWYYGNTTYEVNGKEAILASFDVTTGKFQGKLGQLLLNQNTTLEEVRRVFPVSAKEADVPATGRPGEVMSLPFHYKGKLMDDRLNLVFKKGRLQEVEFYSPC